MNELYQTNDIWRCYHCFLNMEEIRCKPISCFSNMIPMNVPNHRIAVPDRFPECFDPYILYYYHLPKLQIEKT